jgi:hypothetical protein
VKQELIQVEGADKISVMNELDVRKPLVASISQRSEKLRLYNLV